MRKLIEAPTKQCIICGSTFSQRKPSGCLYHKPRWALMQCCTAACASKHRWAQVKEKIPERFWRQVDRRGPDECWPYSGAARDKRGYGGFHYAGHKMMRSHRMAYFLAHGPIPTAYVISHTCNQRDCCNPAHLEAVTRTVVNRCDNGRFNGFERNDNHRTKLTSEQLVQLKAEYAALPAGPSGRTKRNGVVKALAAKYGIAVSSTCRLVSM